MSDKFHKVGNKGMDQFIDPVEPSLEASTYIFSSHQGTDMIENLSIQACISCDNTLCTCDPVDEQTTNIFSQHQGNEMNLNKVLKPSFDNHVHAYSYRKSYLAGIKDDTSELVAYYVCQIDGMTTKVSLVEFGRSYSKDCLPNKTMKVTCANCSSDKMVKLHSNDYTNIVQDDTMESVENRKPQWKEHYVKGCTKCNGMVEARKDLKAKHCQCENPTVVSDNKFFRDISETAGSHDPFTVMGFTPAGAVMDSLHAKVYDRASGQMIPYIEKMVKDIHTRRIMEDDVFATESSVRKITAECDIPTEMIERQHNDMPNLGKSTSAGDMNRKCIVLLNIPETDEESIAIAMRHETRDNIIENINKKIARIQQGNDYDGSNTITQLQINTANKYVGVKPLESTINFETLRKAMTTLFWASEPKYKDAIKAVATKDITTVLVPIKSRINEFKSAMKVIIASSKKPDMSGFNPKGYNDVKIITNKVDENGKPYQVTRTQRFYDISIRTPEEMNIAKKNKQVREMCKAREISKSCVTYRHQGLVPVNSSGQIEMPLFVNGISKVMKSNVQSNDWSRIEYMSCKYIQDYAEKPKAKVVVSINGTKQVAIVESARPLWFNGSTLVESVKPMYVAKNIDIYDYEPTIMCSGNCFRHQQTEAWKNTMPETMTSNNQLLQNYLKRRLNPMTSMTGEKANLIIGAIHRFTATKSNDNSIGVDEKSTPSPLSNKQINIIPSHQETDMKTCPKCNTVLKYDTCEKCTDEARQEILNDMKVKLEIVSCYNCENNNNEKTTGCKGCNNSQQPTKLEIVSCYNCENNNNEKTTGCKGCNNSQQPTKIKLAIVGTSKADPSAYQAVYDRVKSEMDKVGKDNLEIVSGGAKGIDSIGAQVAKDLGLPIKEFLPKEQSKEYFLQRNKQIAEYCTHTVAFVNKLTTTKCYHHGAELANHERTGGCYVGRQLREQGKNNYETIILNDLEKEYDREPNYL